jgi:hypothetical protein
VSPWPGRRLVTATVEFDGRKLSACVTAEEAVWQYASEEIRRDLTRQLADEIMKRLDIEFDSQPV